VLPVGSALFIKTYIKDDSSSMSKKKNKNKKQIVQKIAWYQNMKIVIPVIAAVLIAGAVLTLFLTGVIKMSSSTPKPQPQSYNSPIPMVIDVNKKYTALIKTAKGDLTLELYPQDAPVTVNSFVSLARKGFYNGLTFHRIIPGFMAQGGDPTGTGSGGPGYTIPDEISQRKHVTGALSMAKTAQPNTGGSQFFICYAPQPHLDGIHTVFGQLTQGMDVLKQLVNGDKMTEVIITESN
jgi:peptidyl-prolyl cis-trans isomerase B (cyclophilin B)